MKYLMSQIEYEQLVGLQPADPGVTIPAFTVIYFTATWCGVCRRLDLGYLENKFPDVNFLKCDVDQNNYTPGYCGVRSMPSFVIVKNKQATAPFQSSSTEKVAEWIQSNL